MTGDRAGFERYPEGKISTQLLIGNTRKRPNSYFLFVCLIFEDGEHLDWFWMYVYGTLIPSKGDCSKMLQYLCTMEHHAGIKND